MNTTTTTAAEETLGHIMLRDVRLTFAQGLTKAGTIAGAGPDAKPKFNCGVLIPPDHPQLKQIEAAQIAVAKAKWGEKAAAIFKGLQKQDRLALHDGDSKPKYDGYPGNLFLSPSTDENAPPRYVSGGRVELDAKEAARVFYSGCYVNIAIGIWAQDNKFGQRVNCQLRGIQFLRDGDAFSAARPASTDEFDVVAGADAEDFV